METIITVIIISIIIIGLSFLGLAIRVIFKKNGRFSKKCSSIEFEKGEKIGACGTCEGKKHSQCPKFEKHHGYEAMPAEQIKEAIKEN